MRQKQAGIAAAVFLVLAAYVAVFERSTAPQGSLGALVGIEPGEVQAVGWQPGGIVVHIIRQGDNWQADRPVLAPADPFVAHSVVGYLLETAPRRVLDARGLRLADLGLAPAALTLEYTLTDDRKASLSFGTLNPAGDAYYACTGRRDRVYMVPASAVRIFLPLRPDSVLDHKLADFNPSLVSAITITRARKTVTLTRQGSGWQFSAAAPSLATPSAAAASASAMRGLLASILIHHYELNPSSASTGLDPPHLTIDLQLQDGQHTGVAIGSAVGDEVYARRLSSPTVFRLARRDVDRLQAALPPIP